MWKDSEHRVPLNNAKQNPTTENLDAASNYYYGLICQYSLRMESHRETIDLAIASLEELAGYENCTLAKKLIAQTKASGTRKYRYSVKQITAMLESARTQPSLDSKLANEFYEYIGIPCGYIYYSNQHKRIVSELFSIYMSNKGKLADSYLLILAAFMLTSDKSEFGALTVDQKRELAKDIYQEIIDRKSPWAAEAYYQRGNMLEGSGSDEFRLSIYCLGYKHAVANKQKVLAKYCLEQINHLCVQINWEHVEPKHDYLRAELLKLYLMGLIDAHKYPSYGYGEREEPSVIFFEFLFKCVDTTRRTQIISRLCEEFFIEITHQHHTPEQIQLLERFISYLFSFSGQIAGHGTDGFINYTPPMKQYECLNKCNFTFENNTKTHKSIGEETPLQLLMNQPSINLRQVFDSFHQGAAKNTKNLDGDTLLHIAAKNKWPDGAIELLLDAGLDPNIKNHDGNTVLHILASQRKQELIETLIKKYHANPAILDKNNQTTEQVLAHANNWWTRITNSLGFESNPPAPSAPSTTKEAKDMSTPPPSFGSYPDISAMKADAMAEYTKAKQDETRYANFPSVVGFFGNLLDSLDSSQRIPLQNAGGGMLVGRNSLPDQTLPDANRLAPPQLRPSERVEDSEEEIQQRKADAERLAQLEKQSDAQRLARMTQQATQQNNERQAEQSEDKNNSQKARLLPSSP